MQELLDGRNTKAQLGIFRIQFPRSNQMKTNLRGQTPFAVEAKEKDQIRERMLEFAGPNETQIPNAAKATVAASLVTQVSAFGCAPGMVNNGEIERQGLSNVRMHLSGQREVALISYPHLLEYANATGQNFKDGTGFFDWCETLLKTLITKESLDAFQSAGGTIYQSVCKEGDLLVSPAGFFHVERTLGEHMVVGLRTISVMQGKGSMLNYSMLRDQYQASLSEADLICFTSQGLYLVGHGSVFFVFATVFTPFVMWCIVVCIRMGTYVCLELFQIGKLLGSSIDR